MAIASCRTRPAQWACAKSVTVMTAKNHLGAAKDESNPYFTFDPAKCIVCSRCVRACEEVQGTFALTIDERGFASHVSAGMNEDFLDSECVSCGACVQVCPTATLMEKSIVQNGQPDRSVITTCAYCGVGCTFEAELQGNRVVRMTPYKDGKANHGHSCVKGRFAWGYATHKETHHQADDPGVDQASLAGSELGRGDCPYGVGISPHPGEIRPRIHRRYHQLALHQ